MKGLTDKDAASVLDEIRNWLSQGAKISAVDPKNVLRVDENGVFHGGLLVDGAQSAITID